MNINRIITWGIFIIIIGLIVWGMIAASKKNDREQKYIPLTNEVSSTDWVVGNASSSVLIVEYSDFQCPACALYFPLVEEMIKNDSNRMRFVYRHFPLSQHQHAIHSSQAAEAAGKQGKFWEMYKKIFETHDEWENATSTKEIFLGYASDLGLDMNKYVIDVDSKEIMDKINNDLFGGQKAGVNSTPSFFINGKKINNPQNYEGFKKLIDEAIQTKN